MKGMQSNKARRTGLVLANHRGARTLRPIVAMAGGSKKPPAWQARVDVIDLTLRKKVASFVGYGETLDVLDETRRECAYAVRNGGRYGCSEAKLVFLRYGAPSSASMSVTFYEEPAGADDEPAASTDTRWSSLTLDSYSDDDFFNPPP